MGQLYSLRPHEATKGRQGTKTSEARIEFFFIPVSFCVSFAKMASMQDGVPETASPVSFLLFGGRGWIGGMLQDLLREAGESFAVAKARMEDRESVIR